MAAETPATPPRQLPEEVPDHLADHAVPGVHQKQVIAIADQAQMARRGPVKPIMPGNGDDVARAVIGGRTTKAGMQGKMTVEGGPQGKIGRAACGEGVGTDEESEGGGVEMKIKN